MSLCIIPARGGSKRIVRKNIRDFCGKPMIAWSIEAALQSGCFARVVVSTDDAEIAEVAKSCGAEVPFVRPAALADDFATTGAVMAHGVDELMADQLSGEVCCLYATAPFVESEDLQRGLALLRESQAEYVFSVTQYRFPIQRALRLDESGQLAMFQPEFFQTRSQDLEEAYHDAGQFYWGRSQAWLQQTPIFSCDARPLMLPSHRVQDIDSEEDWLRAEWLFKAMLASR